MTSFEDDTLVTDLNDPVSLLLPESQGGSGEILGGEVEVRAAVEFGVMLLVDSGFCNYDE